MYVRKSKRLNIAPAGRTVFDLAVVEVDEKYRGRGVFKHFLVTLRQRLPRGSILFVECVNNERLLAHLLKRGFVPEADYAECRSVYRRIE